MSPITVGKENLDSLEIRRNGGQNTVKEEGRLCLTQPPFCRKESQYKAEARFRERG